jgi:hypothetical protein
MFTTVSIGIMTNAADDTSDLLSISRLRFIIRCLRLDPASAQFAADVKRLLDRLKLPRRFPGGQKTNSRPFYVPVLEPNYINKRLKDKIDKAAAMEKSIKDI